MNFRFNVNVDERDYLDFNIFWMLRSHYGKKQIKTIRIILAIPFLMIILLSLINGKFSTDSLLGAIPVVIVALLFQALSTKFLLWSVKVTVKNLKKIGKMGYSPEAVFEFSEEVFIETTPENKTEQKYSAIERISIVDGKMIYIHINNVMAYMLPLSCFESKEQYDNFMEFIKEKCDTIDIY